MMKFFVVAVLVSCVLVEQTSALPDIAGIMSGLNQKAMRILKGVTLPVLNSQISFVNEHIEKFVSFFKGKQGEASSNGKLEKVVSIGRRKTDIIPFEGLIGFYKVQSIKIYLAFFTKHILSLATDREIDIPNTPFKIHFTAARCHFLGIGKRLLVVDFQKCKAEASEESIGLSTSCEKGSQKEAIECATQQMLNLLKVLTVRAKNTT